MCKNTIGVAFALFLLCLGISMAQNQDNKTGFTPLTSTYEAIYTRLEILSEVKLENEHYVLSWTLSNKGKNKVKLFAKNINLLICFLPIEDKDFSINLKPGETKTITMNTVSKPMAMNTIEGLGVWDEDLEGYDDGAFITFQIYALSLQPMTIELSPKQ